MSTSSTRRSANAPVLLSASELHGGTSACCPNPNMTAWNSHPRVFIDLSHTREAACPYCGTVYALKEGEVAGGH